VQDGKLEAQIDEETIILTPGQGAFINRDTLHSFHRLDEQDVTFYCIVFHPGIIFGYGTNSLSVKYLSPVLDNPTLKHRILYKEDAYTAPIIDFMNKIHDDYFEGNFGFELACKAHICNMWNAFLQIPRDESNPTVKPKQLLNDEQRIKDAIIYIEQHLADPITLDDIARSIHISKSECCRCFKRVLKQSPFEYLLKHRILHAAKLIRHRDPNANSISNLAITVGFGNISYFNKIFKRYMHMTPTEYKKEQSEIK
jgi:AraC-like DNA-binding protein